MWYGLAPFCMLKSAEVRMSLFKRRKVLLSVFIAGLLSCAGISQGSSQLSDDCIGRLINTVLKNFAPVQHLIVDVSTVENLKHLDADEKVTGKLPARSSFTEDAALNQTQYYLMWLPVMTTLIMQQWQKQNNSTDLSDIQKIVLAKILIRMKYTNNNCSTNLPAGL